MSGEKIERRSAHRTQWAAQFAVASELCKKGYQVAFTMGNHPTVDLMVCSPGGESFSIDVKGVYKPNFWVVKKKEFKDKLFYIFAYVPDNENNRYFILNQSQVNAKSWLKLSAPAFGRIQKAALTRKLVYFQASVGSLPSNTRTLGRRFPLKSRCRASC